MRTIDLSMTIRDHWRWKIEHDVAAKDSFRSSFFRMGAHAFTHVDTPLHCKEGEATIDHLAPDAYSGEAVVMDLSYKRADEPITVEDLENCRHVRRKEQIILLKTCWDKQFSPYGKDYWEKSPYVTEAAAIWLKERNPKVVGFDFPQDYPLKCIDRKGEVPLKEMPTHYYLLNQGILMVEYLCNMSSVTRDRIQFICLPIKLERFEGAPTRALAIEPPWH